MEFRFYLIVVANVQRLYLSNLCIYIIESSILLQKVANIYANFMDFKLNNLVFVPKFDVVLGVPRKYTAFQVKRILIAILYK